MITSLQQQLSAAQADHDSLESTTAADKVSTQAQLEALHVTVSAQQEHIRQLQAHDASLTADKQQLQQSLGHERASAQHTQGAVHRPTSEVKGLEAQVAVLEQDKLMLSALVGMQRQEIQQHHKAVGGVK